MVITDEPSYRVIAVGDIHGHNTALEKLIEELKPSANDKIITLGDYINRGPNSKGVIEQLIELRERCQLIPILGNHDEMLLDARKDRYAFDRFVMSGGKETVESYGTRKLDAVPNSHWEFLESCRDYHETSNFIFTHANACGHTPMKDQLPSVLRWTGVDDMDVCNHRSGKLLIVGHSAEKKVRDFGTCVCIDTGCGFGGILTAYEPATKKRWQVTEDGDAIPWCST